MQVMENERDKIVGDDIVGSQDRWIASSSPTRI